MFISSLSYFTSFRSFTSTLYDSMCEWFYFLLGNVLKFSFFVTSFFFSYFPFCMVFAEKIKEKMKKKKIMNNNRDERSISWNGMIDRNEWSFGGLSWNGICKTMTSSFIMWGFHNSLFTYSFVKVRCRKRELAKSCDKQNILRHKSCERFCHWFEKWK